LWYFQTLPHILRFNDLNVPVPGNLGVDSNSATYWVRGLQSCGISNIAFLVASIAQISPVAGNLVVPSKSENIGWLQQLKFFPVACNLVVFSSIVTYLVSSII
jgi:hypothetical protein